MKEFVFLPGDVHWTNNGGARLIAPPSLPHVTHVAHIIPLGFCRFMGGWRWEHLICIYCFMVMGGFRNSGGSRSCRWYLGRGRGLRRDSSVKTEYCYFGVTFIRWVMLLEEAVFIQDYIFHSDYIQSNHTLLHTSSEAMWHGLLKIICL